jgi:hypothetical protein
MSETFNQEDFLSLVAENMTTEELNALGYEDAEAYAAAFKTQYDTAM